MTQKTPAQQMQEALKTIGVLFIREMDAKQAAIDCLHDERPINQALRADLDGAVRALEHLRSTNKALRAHLDDAVRENNALREKLAAFEAGIQHVVVAK